ncbi:hypothetical protein HD806DRAFT_525197 [Xylariaceae sp. AK1471]|nr:hypothetical protein HD806DRAFT_525197 [Xylariaceae sp. AK1471]
MIFVVASGVFSYNLLGRHIMPFSPFTFIRLGTLAMCMSSLYLLTYPTRLYTFSCSNSKMVISDDFHLTILDLSDITIRDSPPLNVGCDAIPTFVRIQPAFALTLKPNVYQTSLQLLTRKNKRVQFATLVSNGEADAAILKCVDALVGRFVNHLSPYTYLVIISSILPICSY